MTRDASMLDHLANFAAILAKPPPFLVLTGDLATDYWSLPEYSRSLPTGVEPGKVWRAYDGEGMTLLCGYLEYTERQCRIERRLALILPAEATVKASRGESVWLTVGERVRLYDWRVGAAFLVSEAWGMARG
jgi:hypothetical protein